MVNRPVTFIANGSIFRIRMWVYIKALPIITRIIFVLYSLMLSRYFLLVLFFFFLFILHLLFFFFFLILYLLKLKLHILNFEIIFEFFILQSCFFILQSCILWSDRRLWLWIIVSVCDIIYAKVSLIVCFGIFICIIIFLITFVYCNT